MEYEELNWKYRLLKDELFDIDLGKEELRTPFLHYSSLGKILLIKKGYCWDGPSGLTLDTDNSILASLFHDALYQLMRLQLIPLKFRRLADRELRETLKQEGMNFFRRWLWYFALRLFARSAATNQKKFDNHKGFLRSR